MKPKIIFCTALLFFHISGWTQITGKVNYEKLGLSFEIPSGWKGQEGDGIVILGSDVIPGLVLLSTHTYNKQELIQEAQKGINEGNGTLLKLSGNLENLSPHAIGGEFSGTLEWQQAKAYVIGVENPYSGPGVMIMAATLSNVYSAEHEKVCKQIFNSLQFAKIDRSKELAEWKQWLSNVRLTYMNSHYSSNYTDGGISGGYSSERKIDLCAKGYFNYRSNNDMTISGSGVSGYNSGNSAGDGTWKVIIGTSGEPTLILNFQNGEEYSYRLQYTDQKLYMNGDRYFRTTEGEYAPNCY